MSKHISLDSKLLFIFIPTEGGVQREFLETGSNSVFSRKGNLQKRKVSYPFQSKSYN